MIELSQNQSSDKMYNKSFQMTVDKALFRNCSVHYHHMKTQLFHKIQTWKARLKRLEEESQGYQATYVLSFLCNIEENNERHFVSQKQLNLITKQIVDLIGAERDRILREKDNEYQMISQRNDKIFRSLNRLNQLKGPLNPERLIGLEIYSFLLQLNEKFKRSKPEITRLISLKTIVQITQIQQIGAIELFLKSKWEENFAFLDRQIQSSPFGMLIEILFLVLIKRRISKYQPKNITYFDFHQIPFQAFQPQRKYIFKNCDRFKYKFCQLAGFNIREKNLQRKNYLQKGQLNRKIELILEQSQHYDQRFELRALMVEYRLTFKSLSQWIANQLSGISIFPKSQFIVEQLEKCQWSLLKSDRIETNFHISGKKHKNDPKDVLTIQNFVGQSICKIALERFRKYATVLKIQNKLMKEIEKGTSLYIRRFRYSYQYYQSIHHQKESSKPSFALLQREKNGEIERQEEYEHSYNYKYYDKKSKGEKIEQQQQDQQLFHSTDQKKKLKKEHIFTIILGFSEHRNQFAFKYDEQLSQKFYVELLVEYLKTQHGKQFNIFLSELDFERNIRFESTIIRLIQSFKEFFNKFIKFEASPSKFFYHLLAHTYVDKNLSETSFETLEQFSEILSRSLLQIIKLINIKEGQEGQMKASYHTKNQQEQSQDELFDDISNKPSSSQSEQYFQVKDRNYKYDQNIISKKIKDFMTKRISISLQELNQIKWQGKTTFLKKKIPCQYYIFSKDQSNLQNVEFSSNPAKYSVFNLLIGTKQELIKFQSRFISMFQKSCPFLTNVQIADKVKDLETFVHQRNTSLVQIKRLLRNIARNLLIYQAYFNELCFSRVEASNNSKMYISYLGQIYQNEVQNIEKIFPNQLEWFLLKLLKNMGKFPATSKKIRMYYINKTKNNAVQAILKVQQNQQKDYQESHKRIE